MKDGSIIEKLKEMLEEYLKKTEPEYYPPVENLLDLIYEHRIKYPALFAALCAARYQHLRPRPADHRVVQRYVHGTAE